MKYAPIMIQVYDRLDHLKQLIDSLKKDPLSIDTDLYIISDAAYTDEHADSISNIREYADSISGFKTVNIIKPESNLGAIKSFLLLKKIIFENHDNLIFFEDDNKVSPHFLKFMNDCFVKYKDDPKVMYVCGYKYPVDLPNDYNHEVFFYPAVSAWGMGLWKSKDLEVVDLDKASIKKDKKNLNKLKKFSYTTYLILLQDLYSNKILIDARKEYLMIKNDLVAVFPTVSLVKNTGHDGSGLNCGVSNLFQNENLDNNFFVSKLPDNVFIDAGVHKAIYEYKNVSLKTKLFSNVKYKILPFIKK